MGEERERGDQRRVFDQHPLRRGPRRRRRERGQRGDDGQPTEEQRERAVAECPPGDGADRRDDGAIAARQRAEGAAAVERADRQQVEQVDVCRHVRDGGPALPAGGERDRPAEVAHQRAPARAGDADGSVLVGVDRVLLETHQRAEAGDEHRRRRGQAVATQRHDVPHLVHVDRRDQAERELPAPHRPVDRERQQHRPQRRRLAEAGEEQLALARQAEQRGAGRTGGAGPRAFGRRGGHRLRQRVHLLGDELMLAGAVRQQIERLTPRGQRARRIAGGLLRLGIGGELLERGRVHQRATGSARQFMRAQRRGALRAADRLSYQRRGPPSPAPRRCAGR